MELHEHVEIGECQGLAFLELGLQLPDDVRVCGQERPPGEHPGIVRLGKRYRDTLFGHARSPCCNGHENSAPAPQKPRVNASTLSGPSSAGESGAGASASPPSPALAAA